ncbi:MAG: SdpI family protein [Lachnospira sp.]|nr:SdpI family protein [Lachnospira sp.]
MQGFLLYGEYTEVITSATRQAVDIGKIVCILMGVFFIILGNYMTKTRINSIVGFRNKWSMYNDTTWKKSNYFGAIGIMIEGVIAIVAAILMKNSFNAVMLVLILILNCKFYDKLNFKL